MSSFALNLGVSAGRMLDASPRAATMAFPIRMLLFYLAAITIIGKGPTYLGVPPLFWGEIVMILLSVWLLRNVCSMQERAGGLPSLTVAVLLFMTLGAVLTARDFMQWKLDAVRDAALWYYAQFFFVGLTVTRYQRISDRIWHVLTHVWVAALVWGSADLATKGTLSSLGPVLPWRGVGVLSNTGSELGQNIALGAVILMCRHTLPAIRNFRILRTLLALGGLALFAASYGRGQKVAFVIAVLLAVVLTLGRGRPPMVARTLVCALLIAGILGIGIAALADVNIGALTQMDRFEEAASGAQEGTHYWRMIWWEHLNRAVMRNNPWFGLGFGLNLCVYNPYLEGTEDLQWVARSPHNINMTVYSRMGLVGASLWGLILVLGPGRLLLRAWNGFTGTRVYTPARREELLFWLMMLLTTWINSSFGVLMEGPVLGIWFWFALGFACGRSLDSGVPTADMRSRILRALGTQFKSLSADLRMAVSR